MMSDSSVSGPHDQVQKPSGRSEVLRRRIRPKPPRCRRARLRNAGSRRRIGEAARSRHRRDVSPRVHRVGELVEQGPERWKRAEISEDAGALSLEPLGADVRDAGRAGGLRERDERGLSFQQRDARAAARARGARDHRGRRIWPWVSLGARPSLLLEPGSGGGELASRPGIWLRQILDAELSGGDASPRE